jgi:hypothetical protein
MATVREFDVIQSGSGEPFIIIRINDCRASCISLRGRRWDDPETNVKESEHTFGISINTEVDGKFTKCLGKFQGTVEVRKSMLFDRAKKDIGHVYVPMPGSNPKQKRSRRPTMTSIADDDDDTMINAMRESSKRLNAIVTGPSE